MLKRVKCIANDGCPIMLTVGEFYQVAVEVTTGIDHKGRECTGYILGNHISNERGIPRVWDFRRFEVVTEEEYLRIMDERERDLNGDNEEEPEVGSRELPTEFKRDSQGRLRDARGHFVHDPDGEDD